MKKIFFYFLLFVASLNSSAIASVVDGPFGWYPASSMTTMRSQHASILLPDGKVLVVGGHNDYPLSSAELYDPNTNSWSSAGMMATERYEAHTATLLTNGKVLIAGGATSSDYLSSAELYDPATNSWSSAGSMATPRYYHTATLLPSGKVLVAGGFGGVNSFSFLSSAELYDPATNSWSPAGSMSTSHYFHTATVLPNNKVLVAGGYNGSYLSSTELYDPATNSWSTASSMATAHVAQTATLLASGKVLVAGGYSGSSYLSSAELYDPATNGWTLAAPMATAREVHTATLLPNGTVLVTGGRNYINAFGTYLPTAEVYDPVTNNWSSAGSMGTAREYHTATLLQNGKVLVAGGDNGSNRLSSTELYGMAETRIYHVNFIAGINGSLSGSANQAITFGSSTDPVTANPSPGYHLVNWTGDNGFITTTANPLALTNIIADYNITANFAPDPVTGACGGANGSSFTVAPTANLCSAGTPSTVTGTGPWSWSCVGIYGGSTVPCMTGVQDYTYTVSFTAGTGGSLSGTASQTVGYGGTTSQVKAIAESGYYFVNWTDASNTVISTANPLYLKNITANTTITANFSVKTGSSPYNIIFLGSQPSTNGANHYALWGSDGTEAGTRIIKDINPVNGINTNGFLGFHKAGRWMLFAANDGVNGRELWRTDGTTEGTEIVKDLNGLPYSTAYCTYNTSDPRCDPRMCGGCPGFSCNGDPMCEFQISNVPGGSFCDTNSCMTETGSTNFSRFISNGIKAFFMVSTNNWGGSELWGSDGTESGTQKLKDFVYGHYSWAFVGDKLYFGADDGNNNGVWTSDGTAQGTIFVAPSGGSRDSSTYLTFGDKLLFSEPFYTGNVWITDGTGLGTYEILPQSGPEPYSVLWAATSKFGFLGRGSNNNWDLYGLTGAVGEETKLNGGNHDVGEGMTAINDSLYFFSKSGGNYVGPSVTDGTREGTRQIGAIDVGNPPSKGFSKGHSGDVFMWAADHIWGMDPYQNITSLVVGEDGGYPSWIPRFIEDTDKTWFTFKKDGQLELWKTDGTVGGTVLVKALQRYDSDYNDNVYLTKLTLPVDGACGTSNGGAFSTSPPNNLCSSGIPSLVTGTGPWAWTCSGLNGGTASSCTANVQTYSVTFSATAGGSILGATSQTANPGGSTTSVMAVAAVGYSFVNWTGDNGFSTTSVNPLTMSNIRNNQHITANFVGVPAITSSIATKSGLQNARLWGIAVTNTGTAPAVNTIINSIKLTQTSGTACTPVITSPTAFPISLGDIQVGGSGTGTVTIDFTGCVTTARFSANIQYSSNSGGITGSNTFSNQFR